MSRPWSDSTKRLVLIGAGIAIMAFIYAIRQVLPPIILAILLAYVLHPLVNLLTRIRFPHGLAVAIVYLLLLMALAAVPAVVGPGLVQQLLRLSADIGSISRTIQNLIAEYQQLELFGYQVELISIYAQVRGPIERLASGLASGTIGIISGFALTLMWLFFILVVSLYLLLDMERIGQYIDGLIPPLYRAEVDGLLREIGSIWNSFLRGQVALSLVVGICVGLSMLALGVRNAGLLGLIAGILEVIPSIGPLLSMLPALAIAFFLGSTVLSISNAWFTLVVLGVYMLIQQVENNFLVPRIIGRSVNLHPAVILCGAIVGGTVAGVLGVFLAAPTIATFRVLSSYVYGKLLEPSLVPAEALVQPDVRGTEES